MHKSSMSLAQMTSYFPCTASCMAANQNSFSGSFEMVQKQASQEWPLVAQSGRSHFLPGGLTE
jgi:hypothetical protein